MTTDTCLGSHCAHIDCVLIGLFNLGVGATEDGLGVQSHYRPVSECSVHRSVDASVDTGESTRVSDFLDLSSR